MSLICECGYKNPNKGLYCSICGQVLYLPTGKNFILKKRYEILALTGGGGMGTVYKARDVKLEKIWAVKECVPHRISQKKSDIEDIKNRFEREAKILARLDHPGLPVISDYFTENNRYYLVMAYIEGENFLDILKKDGNPGISEEKVTGWAKEILKILSYLHNQSPPVVYRDLKPANIMLHKDGRIILVDFGIARVINPDDLTGQTVMGTKGYAPVEQSLGKAEPRSDLYALGATIHHLLTGKRPGESGLKSLKEFVPSISDEMENIVAKSLKENVTERFFCADEMLKALFFNGKGYERKVPERKAVVISPGVTFDRKGYERKVPKRKALVIAPGVTFVDKWEKKTVEPWYFNKPKLIAVDNQGYVYVADTDNHRIQKFDFNGRFISSWGKKGTELGEFIRPEGIAVDNQGYVYIADTFNYRIQKFDTNGSLINTWGNCGYKDGEFIRPEGIAVDNQGYVYVADTDNHRIQKFDANGRFITTWSKRGCKGIAVDTKGYVYISDTNHRIQKFDTNGSLINTWGNCGYKDGEFTNPYGIAVDTKGYVYVADTNNNRIQKFDSHGEFITTCKDGEFFNPKGIAVDAKGYVYIADINNNRIQKFDSHGKFIIRWDRSGSEYGNIEGIAVDTKGYVYVTDNHHIQKFDSNGRFIDTWGQEEGGCLLRKRSVYWKLIDPLGQKEGGDNYEFRCPTGIAVDTKGYVYVTDTNNHCIQKFNFIVRSIDTWGREGDKDYEFSIPEVGEFYICPRQEVDKDGEFSNPKGIAVDTKGYVYVTDTNNHRIQKFGSNGMFITKWGKYGSKDGKFNYPSGIAVDNSCNVYVADTENHRIQKFDSKGRFITSWGKEGNEDGEFNHPFGIAVDNQGHVYVSDTGNNRIQVFKVNL